MLPLLVRSTFWAALLSSGESDAMVSGFQVTVRRHRLCCFESKENNTNFENQSVKFFISQLSRRTLRLVHQVIASRAS
jgi:hypothetical protein